jgi:hypothetical protein
MSRRNKITYDGFACLELTTVTKVKLSSDGMKSRQVNGEQDSVKREMYDKLF